ncbi:hypothetical protein GCM10029978_060890 [Actinoallomurus acanthiterrae]
MTESGTYLYAIAPDTRAALPSGLTGLLGAPVRTITEAGLVAYAGSVPLEQFGEEGLKRNLEDLAWLEATARAHHQVVEAAAAVGPVAPVRLVTVYRDDEQIRRLLRERAEEFTDVLARVTGRREWGVKIYATGRARPIRRRADARTFGAGHRAARHRVPQAPPDGPAHSRGGVAEGGLPRRADRRGPGRDRGGAPPPPGSGPPAVRP